MDILYVYKDKEFKDIREIIQNNKLAIDFGYLLGEYIPYQVFISGKTIFKDVTIKATERYVPNDPNKIERFDYDFFLQSLRTYLEKHDEWLSYNKDVGAAVSGGIDSSSVALAMEPQILYSGYYDDPECDERHYAKDVAKEMNAKQCFYKLTEEDFLKGLDDYVDVFGTPAGGFGGVMEYITLKKFVEDNPNVKVVLFGNGGDEIFMGYFFNYYVKHFCEFGNSDDKYMNNFLPSKKGVTKKLIDDIIVYSINRSPGKFSHGFETAQFYLHPVLKQIDDVVDKLLYININITLPTLLHLNNQFCKALNVVGFNPLSNIDLIKASKFINTPMSDKPKWKLRVINDNMPKSIINNTIKRGFPIPIKNWKTFNITCKRYYDAFFTRRETNWMKKPPYSFVDRFSWGIFLAEKFLEKYYN